MDEYASVSKGSLKLKGDSGVKKKKKKSDLKKKVEDHLKAEEKVKSGPAPEGTVVIKPGLTKAEKSFLEKQEKRQTARILEKASKSHKKRVEEFNAHLDSLTEHYDIPKVSWTK